MLALFNGNYPGHKPPAGLLEAKVLFILAGNSLQVKISSAKTCGRLDSYI
jgi:hypothetical protein